MKTLSRKLLPIFLLTAVYAGAMAASISGTISYSGASTGQIAIIALTDTTQGQTPAAIISISSPGSYSITGLADSVYYILSFRTNASGWNVKMTDPWGYYGTPGTLSPVTISGGVNVSGIDITLEDGTIAHPNPFYRAYLPPTLTIPLPAFTGAGNDPSIAFIDSSIYLYKHDSTGAASGKIYKINPSSGNVTSTFYLTQESSANGICWIGKMVYHNGAIWVNGGYGDPSGSGYVNGVFIIDIATSKSSNQIPADTGIDLSNELGGLTSDGVNLYVGVTLKGAQRTYGIVKFNPSLNSNIPISPFFDIGTRPSYLSYGSGFLWAGVDSLKKIDPSNGTILASYNVPAQAAGLYHDNMFWMYDENDTTLKAYSLAADGVARGKGIQLSSFKLSQNYPNPFNPTTNISFTLISKSFVSLKVFDMLGHEVATLVNEQKPAGTYTQKWNAASMPSGVYFYRLQAGSLTETKKLILLK